MTSTLLIARLGMVLTSTASEALPGCGRRPSTRTRLRFVPNPRRFGVASPGVLVGDAWMLPIGVNWVFVGTNCGIWLRTDSVPVEAVFSNASLDTVVIGLGAS